jgi:hypothetical protein
LISPACEAMCLARLRGSITDLELVRFGNLASLAVKWQFLRAFLRHQLLLLK